MEYRLLGRSGLNVSVLTFGTATFGGEGDFFKKWGNTQEEDAKKMIRLCLDAGVNMFDTADRYSSGLSEEILGKALAGLRHEVLISTKATFSMGEGPNDFGSSRYHVIRACEASLRRLNTDYIDLYYMHGFDGRTPVEETLRTLDDLVSSGKIRYIACSNFSGWHLMKSLSISEREGWSPYICHQAYYSLTNREFEWELMPLGIDQNVGTVIWSPLAGGKLSGKFRRNQPMPENSRIAQGGGQGPPVPEDRFYAIMEVLDEISLETGKAVPQIALNWLLQRPTVDSIVIGARTVSQLAENLGSAGWTLTREHIQKLDAVSDHPAIYPYWHQRGNPRLNPLPI